MRRDDIIGGTIGMIFGIHNSIRMWRSKTDALAILDVFFINFAVCIVCYFLNPDINMFNMYFFNGSGWGASYDKAIVNSLDYFPESPILFVLFYVSLIFSVASLTLYTWVKRMSKSTSDGMNPSTSTISNQNSIIPSPQLSHK